MRVTLQKYGGSIGEPGSVSWQFEQKGIISIAGKVHLETVKGKEEEIISPYDEGQLELDAIELGAEDIEFDNNMCIVTTAKQDYITIDHELSQLGYKIISSDIEAVCDNMMNLSESDRTQLDVLLEHLEDDEDVEKVWTNAL